MPRSHFRGNDDLFGASLRANLIETHLWIHPGDYIDRINIPKFGIAFFEFASAQEMTEKMSAMDAHMSIYITMIP